MRNNDVTKSFLNSGRRGLTSLKIATLYNLSTIMTDVSACREWRLLEVLLILSARVCFPPRRDNFYVNSNSNGYVDGS